MRRCILASHHRFAEGLRDTLEFIGGVQNVDVVCAYVDETPLDEQVSALFSSFDPSDEVLILTDIMQGSVNQAFAPYMGEKVFLVAGANVACALELLLSDEPLSTAFVGGVIEAARQAMVLMNTYRVADDDDDE